MSFAYYETQIPMVEWPSENDDHLPNDGPFEAANDDGKAEDCSTEASEHICVLLPPKAQDLASHLIYEA
jgi:hypothetical protein